ncbi:MAG: hypothetical protein ABSD74_15665 [Rhizomicrobium sp.]
MKCAVLVVTALAAGTMISAASAASAPQFVGVIEERDPSNGNYTELERQTPVQSHSVEALGWGSYDDFLEFVGERSPVRFKSGTPLEFVVAVQHQDTDPQESIQFWRLLPKDGKRSLHTGHAGSGMLSSTTTSVTDEQRVLFSAETFGGTFYKIVATQPLPPGEYSLNTTTNPESFNFGIDP